MMVIYKYLLAWLAMPVIGIFNGVIRELTYGKYLGELLAHQISTLTGIVLFGIYVYFLSKNWMVETAGQAVVIGLVWLCLTVAFEFLFGHYVMKHSWQKLLRDYNIQKGRLWLLVLVWITIAPYVMYKINA
jgi:hypothetical protein